MESIDLYGFRSLNILKKAEKEISFNKDHFLCPSGIADKYIKTLPEKNNEIRKLLFVGQLIERKHPETILNALAEIKDRNYELTIVGIGSQNSILEQKASELGVNVRFMGKLPHQDVLRLMRQMDCFIMVSEAEVFGLVYLEAMSQGCITIAAKEEGMDGIIKDGHNGFLCRAGDVAELKSTLDRIENMSGREIGMMRENGFNTAIEYSETEVAKQYLLNLLEGA